MSQLFESILNKIDFSVKTGLDIFAQLLGRIRLLFILTSGHAGANMFLNHLCGEGSGY